MVGPELKNKQPNRDKPGIFPSWGSVVGASIAMLAIIGVTCYLASLVRGLFQ